MKVYFVGAGPGDPDLLTVKARRLLENCAICIYAGSLVSPDVVAIVPSHAEKHDSASMDLPQIVAVFQDANARNIDVVRLHTGDPSIYGAIGEQMTELDKLGIDYEVVPGVSSFQATAAALKTELTAPETAQTIILTRASGRTPVPPEQDLEILARTHATLCIFLSVHKMAEAAEMLASALWCRLPCCRGIQSLLERRTHYPGHIARYSRKSPRCRYPKDRNDCGRPSFVPRASCFQALRSFIFP
jgi:precorrin-4/cobalt-precorrin-4 C11-methyltransferase